MARHIEAWMDGVQLSSIGPILIQDVNEPSPDMEITYTARSQRNGQDIQNRRRKALRVTLQTALREIFDLSKRTQALQAMGGWAQGNILELSNHPDQRLHVICKSEPALGNVRQYTTEIPIEFEASVIPFWEEKYPSTASGSGASGSLSMLIPGTAPEVPVEITFTPGSTISALTVTVACGGVTRQIALSGMSVSGAIVFGRDDQDRLTIKSGSTSLLRYRSAASADDLLIPAGKATISWSASASGSISVSARGRWL